MPSPHEPRRIRAWILNHYAIAPDIAGGTRHHALARALVLAGGDATVFASGYDPSNGTRGRLRPAQAARTRLHDGVRFLWLRTTPYRGNTWLRMVNMLSFAVMAGLAELGRPRPDVVIGSTVHPFAALAGWWIARRRGARFVFEIRDLWPQTLVDLGAMRPGSPIARGLWTIEAFLVRRADAVLTLLPGVRAYLEDRGLPSDHVRYLPNGVDLDAADRDARDYPLKAAGAAEVELVYRDHSEGRIVLVYLGAHGRVNALQTVLEAFALAQRRSSAPMRLFMVGDGPEKPALRAFAEREAIGDVRWLDPIPKSRVPGFLRSVDVGIVHTTRTPVYRFGISFNKLFDYMAAGLPVAFACAAANDPVAEAAAGVTCPPDDPVALGDAIVRLAEARDDERRAMGAAGRAYVARHHDMATLGGDFVALLLEVVAAGRPVPPPSPPRGPNV